MTDNNNCSETIDKLAANVGRLLNDLAKDFELRTLKKYHARGYKDIRSSHCSFLSNLGFKQTRLTDLASRARITQQAMGKLVKELEIMGYITRQTDKSDKRAKLISLTTSGEQLLRVKLDIIDEVVAEYTDRLGTETVVSLLQILRRCITSLDIQSLSTTEHQALKLTH